LCEAVFYMSSRLEGYTLDELALDQPPGDPRASPLRSGIIQFRPLPGSVWSHDPATFRLEIECMTPALQAIRFPERIAAAVRDFMAEARPIVAVAASHGTVDLVPTNVRKMSSRTGEELIRGYTTVMATATSFVARGKLSASAARDYMYQYMSGQTDLRAIRTIWMSRYLAETIKGCGMSALIDETLVRQLASRFSDCANDMRVKLATEANRRGTTLELWWADITALLPKTLKSLKEGSASWAIALAHFLIFPYSHKWAGLPRALAHQSHRALAAGVTRAVRLPAEVRSAARVYEAARSTTRALAASYGAYYAAMYEVGMILAAQMFRAGNPVAEEKLQLAAGLWDIRAKVASTADLVVATPAMSGLFGRTTGPYAITTAPHAAYGRWQSRLSRARCVNTAMRRKFPHHIDGRVSGVFESIDSAIFPMGGQAAVRLFRYAASPARLAIDIEATLRMMADDTEAVVHAYELEELPTDFSPTFTRPTDTTQFTPIRSNMSNKSYWGTLVQMTKDDAVMIDDQLGDLPEDKAAAIMENTYDTPQDLMDVMAAALGEVRDAKVAAQDYVD